MPRWPVAVALLVLPAVASADDLSTLLAKGPIASIETKADGRVSKVTAIEKIAASPDVVWKKIVDFQAYTTWMPQVAQSDVLSTNGDTVVVDWSIATPGPNVSFEGKYVLDATNRTVDGSWVSGALQGSTWQWKVVADGTGSLVYRTAYSSAVSDNWLLRQFDDSSHTLELGLNAATPIVELQALKKACESSPGR